MKIQVYTSRRTPTGRIKVSEFRAGSISPFCANRDANGWVNFGLTISASETPEICNVLMDREAAERIIKQLTDYLRDTK